MDPLKIYQVTRRVHHLFQKSNWKSLDITFKFFKKLRTANEILITPENTVMLLFMLYLRLQIDYLGVATGKPLKLFVH